MNIIMQHIKHASVSCISPIRISKSFILLILIWTGIAASSQAQLVEYSKPSWWFGVAAGANFNMYRGSTQKLNSSFTAPVSFNHGDGAGLYLAPLVEYTHPSSGLGFMLQTGYDSRSSDFTRQITPCNCPADLTTKLSYITLEPSLRISPFHSNFYIYAGPRIAFNVNKSFTYKLGPNPAIPDQEPTPDVKGDLSDVHETLLSMQIGAGYDIPLSTRNRQTQFVFSPFVAFHPYFGQAPRSIETWTVATIRVGAALKFGHGTKIIQETVIETIPLDPDVRFTVNSPRNVPMDENEIETFPLRNYVFFDLNSTAIPDRYVTLRKDQVKDFREDQLDLYKPKNASARSERQMIVYYNILNILGDRLIKNPAASVTLVGSSEKGPEDGRAMAQSIKDYLVNIFAVTPSRINIEGRNKPELPSEQPGATLELDLLRQGDRRVSIESATPALLMEFQDGPTASLRPVQIRSLKEAPQSSYVTFDAPNANKSLASWSLEVKDDKGVVKNFGPYTQDKVSLPGSAFLGTRPSGDFKVTMVGQTKNGKTIRKEVPMNVVLWTPAKNINGMRYSILYEFNDATANKMYEKYLTDIVVPQIPAGAKVLVRGYTDIIGDATHNHELSHARANDVKGILEAGLMKAGRTDITFEAVGFGEDEKMSLFDNKYPEERFYNRTVVIDVIPRR